MSRKRTMIIVVLVAFMAIGTAFAQNEYFVRTNNVKKAVASPYDTEAEEGEEEDDEAQDFIGKNFKYRSMCNWTDGMRFMVIPDKRDLIMTTFVDSATNKEVGCGKLRHKVLDYKGHDVGDDGYERLIFRCEDDDKVYYYELPRGGFEAYCYGKQGVPSLAYLGDVDRARELLMGATLYTRAATYRIDTDAEGDGYEEVTIPLNEEVTVASIGVGTRAFPVKIIVEDKNGKQFYQTVAMSKINCGMRDEEFDMWDQSRFLFGSSFELADANLELSAEYSGYIGRKVYTRYDTKMVNAAGDQVSVVRHTNFEITAIMTQNNTNYVKMTLRNLKSGELYVKEVTFVNDDVAGDIDGYKEDYYNYIFLEGSAPAGRASKTAASISSQSSGFSLR